MEEGGLKRPQKGLKRGSEEAQKRLVMSIVFSFYSSGKTRRRNGKGKKRGKNRKGKTKRQREREREREKRDSTFSSSFSLIAQCLVYSLCGVSGCVFSLR